MAMREPKLRAVLEDLDDLGLLVFTDGRRGRYVKNHEMSPLGFYDVHEDGAFRFGWVELPGSQGRQDCIDWRAFYDLIRSQAKKAVQR